MHCELVVPGLFSAEAFPRLPALELLLARGRRAGSDPASLEAWLAGRFGLGDDPLPMGALTVFASGRDPGMVRWARADPVHLRLLRDRMVIVPAAAFPISGEEATALVATLNAHFAGRLEFEAAAPDRWIVRLSMEAPLGDASPLDVAGRSLAPGKADALANEIQMVLHEHPVNEAREARGEPAVNSLWLWGAGVAPRGASGAWESVASDEPAGVGLARAAGLRSRPLPATADAWIDRLPAEGRQLAVLDSLRASIALSDPALPERLLALEAKWFAPLLAALRAGRIGMVTVHVPEAGASSETIRADLRRFWRRPKPLRRSTIAP